jgi:hypothetical protein
MRTRGSIVSKSKRFWKPTTQDLANPNILLDAIDPKKNVVKRLFQGRLFPKSFAFCPFVIFTRSSRRADFQ